MRRDLRRLEIRRWRRTLNLIFRARDESKRQGREWAAELIAFNARRVLFDLGGLMGEW